MQRCCLPIRASRTIPPPAEQACFAGCLRALTSIPPRSPALPPLYRLRVRERVLKTCTAGETISFNFFSRSLSGILPCGAGPFEYLHEIRQNSLLILQSSKNFPAGRVLCVGKNSTNVYPPFFDDALLEKIDERPFSALARIERCWLVLFLCSFRPSSSKDLLMRLPPH